MKTLYLFFGTLTLMIGIMLNFITIATPTGSDEITAHWLSNNSEGWDLILKENSESNEKSKDNLIGFINDNKHRNYELVLTHSFWFLFVSFILFLGYYREHKLMQKLELKQTSNH